MLLLSKRYLPLSMRFIVYIYLYRTIGKRRRTLLTKHTAELSFVVMFNIGGLFAACLYDKIFSRKNIRIKKKSDWQHKLPIVPAIPSRNYFHSKQIRFAEIVERSIDKLFTYSAFTQASKYSLVRNVASTFSCRATVSQTPTRYLNFHPLNTSTNNLFLTEILHITPSSDVRLFDFVFQFHSLVAACVFDSSLFLPFLFFLFSFLLRQLVFILGITLRDAIFVTQDAGYAGGDKLMARGRFVRRPRGTLNDTP